MKDAPIGAAGLQVQMFGGFSMTWQGTSITGGSKTRESQFFYLMQTLLHNRTSGVRRELLEAILFENREISNPRHTMQTIIYNAKKKLRQAGLPDVNYIEQRSGVFFWTDQIPVYEDAEEFERLCKQAEGEKDLDSKLELFLEAIHLYAGEFLPNQTAVPWAAQEARRYRSMFFFCVEQAVLLLRMNQDYFQMEALGQYAARIAPLADWETVIMEALVSMGRVEDAQRLYDDTVALYLQEQGLRPSKQLMDILQQLGDQMEHRYAALDSIQAELSEEETTGGYVCTYPVFRGIYQMVRRMMERGGQSVYLMLCTVVDSKGTPMKDGPKLDELSLRLGDSICHSVRLGDAVCRYGRGQYLVLLVNCTRENCDVVQKRINYKFLVNHQRTGIQYYVNSVICQPGMLGNGLGLR